MKQYLYYEKLRMIEQSNREDARKFKRLLSKHNLKVVETGDEGNCLFETVADQMFGDMDLHYRLRQKACDYMGENKELYANYMEYDCNIDDYVEWMREDGNSAGQVELNILAQLFKFNAIIHKVDEGGTMA